MSRNSPLSWVRCCSNTWTECCCSEALPLGQFVGTTIHNKSFMKIQCHQRQAEDTRANTVSGEIFDIFSSQFWRGLFLDATNWAITDKGEGFVRHYGGAFLFDLGTGELGMKLKEPKGQKGSKIAYSSKNNGLVLHYLKKMRMARALLKLSICSRMRWYQWWNFLLQNRDWTRTRIPTRPTRSIGSTIDWSHLQ